MNIGYWICSLPSRSLLARLIVLAAVMLAAYGGVLCVVAGHGDTAGMVAASLAAGVCLASAAAALLISQRLRDPANGLAGILLPMATRTGVPLLLAMLIRFRGGGLVEAGLLYYLVGFYLLALAVEVPMSLPCIERSERCSEEGTRRGGKLHG